MSLHSSDVIFLLTCPALKAKVAYGLWRPEVSKYNERSIFAITEKSEVMNNSVTLKIALADHSSENFQADEY